MEYIHIEIEILQGQVGRLGYMLRCHIKKQKYRISIKQVSLFESSCPLQQTGHQKDGTPKRSNVVERKKISPGFSGCPPRRLLTQEATKKPRAKHRAPVVMGKVDKQPEPQTEKKRPYLPLNTTIVV